MRKESSRLLILTPKFACIGAMGFKRYHFLLLIVSLTAVFARAQLAPELQTLEPGKPIDRKTAGGETHSNRSMVGVTKITNGK